MNKGDRIFAPGGAKMMSGEAHSVELTKALGCSDPASVTGAKVSGWCHPDDRVSRLNGTHTHTRMHAHSHSGLWHFVQGDLHFGSSVCSMLCTLSLHLVTLRNYQ